MSVAPTRRGLRIEKPRPHLLLTVLGMLAATAPAWLFGIAALTTGPRTSVLLFGVPVLLSPVLAIIASRVLDARGQRPAALAVGILALVVGVVMFVIWAYLAGVGVRFGDGPL